MILSRTMRESDYPELIAEGGVIMSMQNVTSMWHQSLYRNSLWEYAMAYHSIREVFGNRWDLKVADYGYNMGLPPLLMWLGYDLTVIEIHRRPPEEENFLIEHLRRVAQRRTTCAGKLSWWPKEIGPGTWVRQNSDGKLEAMKYDVVCCCSMLHRLGNAEQVFLDMCSLVKTDGVLFLTTSEEDKEPKIRVFTQGVYEWLRVLGMSRGFRLVDGKEDWNWKGMENSFISMVLRKELRKD